MPVTTRRNAAATFKRDADKKAKTKTGKKTKEDVVETDIDSWEAPSTNLRSSVIKTYSKKQPLRTCWTFSSKKNVKSKNAKDCHGMHMLSKPDIPGKPQRTKLSEENANKKLTGTTSVNIRKPPPKKSSALKRARNETRLAVESMAACTVLATKSDDVNFATEDMSLCSVVQAGIKDRESNIVRNSTFLSNCHEINEDFVPNEISVIEEENKLPDNKINNEDERTPENKPIQTATAKSVKKVRFDVSRRTPKNQSVAPKAQRNIFRKTPYRNENNRKFPKTSSPDPKEHLSMLHCEISTLLIDEDYPGKNKVENASDEQMTQNTEKLMDFEPVPFQCSENIEEDLRDITPETCISAKAQTSSVKRRRRLSYHINEKEIPACILLDFPVSKTRKKSTVCVGKNPSIVSIEEVESFPDDILK